MKPKMVLSSSLSLVPLSHIKTTLSGYDDSITSLPLR